MRRNLRRINYPKLITILLLSAGSIIMLFPFIWMVSTSFKTPPQVISYPPTLIPRPPTLEYYNQIFTKLNFGRFFLNSAYISTIITASVLLTSSFVGYVFAKFDFWGKEFIFIMILSTMMIPFAVTMIPLYLIMSKLGWVDSHLALIIPGLYSTFGIFLMRQFMSTVPNELREAAIVDGCGEFRTFWSIILPQCKPALAALGIFTFMWNWDNFLWPLIVLNSENNFTLPVGLSMFSRQWWTNYGLVMAGATVSVIPILIVFFIFQRHFIEGIVLTGLKA